MAGKMLNIKVYSPLKPLRSLSGQLPRNLPLLIQFTVVANNDSSGIMAT